MEGVRIACLYALGCPELKERPEDERVVLGFIEKPAQEKLPRVRAILKGLDPFIVYRIIGIANGIEDPFSEDVVRAYWLGGRLLQVVTADMIRLAIADRFHSSTFITVQRLIGRKPHHNLSVFQLLAIVSKSTIEMLPQFLEGANDCLVAPGRIITVKPETIRVETPSILPKGQGFTLAVDTRKVKKGFVERPRRGEYVSIHFGSARERISGPAAAVLRGITFETFQVLQGGKV